MDTPFSEEFSDPEIQEDLISSGLLETLDTCAGLAKRARAPCLRHCPMADPFTLLLQLQQTSPQPLQIT